MVDIRSRARVNFSEVDSELRSIYRDNGALTRTVRAQAAIETL